MCSQLWGSMITALSMTQVPFVPHASQAFTYQTTYALESILSVLTLIKREISVSNVGMVRRQMGQTVGDISILLY